MPGACFPIHSCGFQGVKFVSFRFRRFVQNRTEFCRLAEISNFPRKFWGSLNCDAAVTRKALLSIFSRSFPILQFSVPFLIHWLNFAKAWKYATPFWSSISAKNTLTFAELKLSRGFWLIEKNSSLSPNNCYKIECFKTKLDAIT